MRQVKRGSISKKLGIPTGERLTKEVLKEKIRILEEGLAADRYKGDLRKYAVYYKSWYSGRLTREIQSPRRAAKGRPAARLAKTGAA